MSKTYLIIGQNISQSLSPPIHNAAFAHYNLPHHYSIHECADTASLQPIINSPSFGGASVTMPHKLSVGQFCTRTTDAAVRIGAINTLIADDGKEVVGDNTDWSGLYALLRESPTKAATGLVIGAGGAARAAVYAMIQAGCEKVYIANRTLSKAETIKSDFADIASTTTLIPVGSLAAINEAVDVIIGTIPGDVMTEDSLDGLALFQGKGLCVEMSYKPKVTPLMNVAKREGWTVVDGLEVLLRQAFEQSKLWTGRDAPELVMREAIQRVNSRI